MWRSIAADIERDIRLRVLNAGDRLPSEHALVRKYFVTRHAVRTALAHLGERGLIESTQGRGSYVRRPTLPYYIQRRTRFSEIVEGASATHENQTISIDSIPASHHLAAIFNVRPGTAILRLERLAIVNDQPTGISRHHFLGARVPGFTEAYQRRRSITATLCDLGILDYVRVQTRIHARAPTAEECALLAMPHHVPIITTQAINHDLDGRIVEYGESRFASDRIDLVIMSEPETSQP
ncbi:MAG: phosphonate metabolism transcriptional regulator PhnF [Sandarakinorhabdus sp.]|jgi:phosphonate metabolism transcriptional regulator PhnF